MRSGLGPCLLTATALATLPACGRSYLDLGVEVEGGATSSAGGSVGDGGAAVDSGAEAQGTTCPAGQTACDGTCVDTQTDQGNCGGCGLTCPQPCNAGRCIAVVASNVDPLFIAVDDTRVAWTSGGGGSLAGGVTAAGVMTAPKTGGMPTTLATLFSSNVALKDTDAYWADTSGLEMAPVGGGQPRLVGAGQISQYGALVAADTNNLYWADQGNRVVMQMPLAGGMPTTLAVHTATGLAVDSTSVYFITALGLLKVPIGGGTVSTLSQNLSGGSLAVTPAGAYVAWGDGIYRVPLDGGAVETLVPNESVCSSDGGVAEPWDCFTSGEAGERIAADAIHVYWTGGPHTPGVFKMPLAGGSPETLVTGSGGAAPIAVDDTSIYWGDQVAGVIVRLTPK